MEQERGCEPGVSPFSYRVRWGSADKGGAWRRPWTRYLGYLAFWFVRTIAASADLHLSANQCVGVESEPHPKQLSRGVSTTAKCFSIGIAREAQDSRSRKNAQLPGFFGP